MTGFNVSPLSSKKGPRNLFSKRRISRFCKDSFSFMRRAFMKVRDFFVSLSRVRISSSIPVQVQSPRGSSISWNRIGNMTILFVLGLLILQPTRFEVETKKNISSSTVYAKVTEKASNGDDGSVKFDMFIPGSNESGDIVYEVASGDTLSEIAKRFGTTTSLLLSSNDIGDANNLRKGQKITISNEGGEIIYEVEKPLTVAEFSDEFDIDLEEVLELNYLPNKEFELVEGHQLFLNLTREQAEVKGLWQTPEYVRPEGLVEDIPEEMLVDASSDEGTGSLVAAIIGGITGGTSSGEALLAQQEEVLEPLSDIERLIDQGEPQQVVISATETSDQLEAQQVALEEAIQKAKDEEERKKLEEEKRILEEKVAQEKEAQRKLEEQRAQEEREQAAQQEVITAEQTTDRLEQPEEEAPVEIEQEVITAEQTTDKIEQITSCGPGKCLHKGKCRSAPEHAYCTPDDDQNAWKCEDGYVDTSRSCVEEKVYEEKTSTRGTQPAKKGTIAQWYFNPYNDGYGNGWGAGHCTHYSGRYWWKHYGIMTNWRGNGGQWYWNASAAGWQVGSTPEVGAIFVADSGSGRWSSYGHVGIVIKVDWASNSILVEDMNYAGRYIVTQRWMSMNESGLIGYVYPRKK